VNLVVTWNGKKIAKHLHTTVIPAKTWRTRNQENKRLGMNLKETVSGARNLEKERQLENKEGSIEREKKEMNIKNLQSCLMVSICSLGALSGATKSKRRLFYTYSQFHQRKMRTFFVRIF